MIHCSNLQEDCLKFIFVKVFFFLISCLALFPSSCSRTFDNKLFNHVMRRVLGSVPGSVRVIRLNFLEAFLCLIGQCL